MEGKKGEEMKKRILAFIAVLFPGIACFHATHLCLISVLIQHTEGCSMCQSIQRMYKVYGTIFMQMWKTPMESQGYITHDTPDILGFHCLSSLTTNAG